MTKLPEKINVMQVVSYDVPTICQEIHDTTDKPFDEITIEECLDYIDEWIVEDFRIYDNLIFQDENGNDL